MKLVRNMGVGCVLFVVLTAACRMSPSNRAVETVSAKAAPIDMPHAALGASAASVHALCAERGGAFVSGNGTGTCRSAKAEWASVVDVRVWFQDGRLAAQTSSGPLESFDEARARADRLATLAWGQPEEEARTYVCSGMDVAARVQNGRERKCRYSRFWREEDRVVHVLVTSRGAGLWQTVLDEQRATVPGPALMDAPYPTEMGPFHIGDSVSQAKSACTAAGARYAPPSGGLAASCRAVDVPSLKLRGATAWLAQCKAGLCRATFVVDAATSQAAVEAFVSARDVLMHAFGPPANIGLGVCAPASASRLAAALELGHCEPVQNWKKDDGFISLQARPADNQTAYPPTRYSVLVTYSTPMYEKEQRALPPADFALPR